MRQHAENPIDWHPWESEAWDRAKSSNQLVVVSIGYSTCHWCHVMAHEVFEDLAVAQFQNPRFVSIKVDREERPDIDKVYMDACQFLSGQGGWPLNMICLPDGRPVQASTYLPKEIWLRLLGQIHLLWIETPERLVQQADAVAEGVRAMDMPEWDVPQALAAEGFRRPADELFREIWSRIMPHCDEQSGGLAGAPKFPVPVLWECLLELSHREKVLQHAFATQQSMAYGGIFDQIAGGFFRYSTDAQWHIPHFEKMLYDNAQLLSLYARSLRTHPSNLGKRVLRLSVAWMQESLRSPEGLWFSALNADTNGVEGATYVWTQEQVFQAAPESALLEDALRVFDISSHGNWENGQSHPRIAPALARDWSDEEYTQELEQLEPLRLELLKSRNLRAQPSRDEKILLEWNALAARGFLDAGRALADLRLVSTGLDTLEAIFQHLRTPNAPLHRSLCEGKLGSPAFLSDLVMLAEACLCAHETTLSSRWLQEARTLVEDVLARFGLAGTPFYQLVAHDGEPLFAPAVDFRDDVIPSANSTLARLLMRMGHLLENQEWIRLGETMVNAMRETALNIPLSHPNWIRAIFDMHYPLAQIQLQGADAQRWAREVWMLFPRTMISGSFDRQGVSQATVCANQTCLPPVFSLKDLLQQLAKASQ